jgi:hypothetical protein
MSESRSKLTINTDFFNIISERIKSKNNDFNSVDEYVDFVLSEVLEKSSDQNTKAIENELKKLGYI